MDGMDNKAVVLVPRRDGDPERDGLWAWVRRFWEARVGIPIVEGHHGVWGDTEPFNRSVAINRAAEAAGDWDVAVIIDGDVALDPRLVQRSVERAPNYAGPILSYTERAQLSQPGTRQALLLDPADVDLIRTARNWRRFTRHRLRNSCSSCLVVNRRLWDVVGGFDELFVGWGYEDVAFRVATETVSESELVKTPGTLYHLWHTVSSGNNQAEPTYQANKVRGEEYVRRRWDKAAMNEMIQEHLEARRHVGAESETHM